ncbi:MAG: U32 family peptidase [Oscillospiraceae bacterium]|nr:U32 family peptidase [Oscillospiraceae bacterium]
MMNKIEILAPAGNSESLKAAVLSGADAVYFGVGKFNARRNADNFSKEELNSTIKYCHSRGVKVHITLNTLIKDTEIAEAAETVKTICDAGADAVIVQDLGVAKIVRSVCPQMPMHASTQMTVGTREGLKALKNLGFSRAVLPRELNFSEIKELCEDTPLELEMFVHGALCMCVSGQCLMSSVLGSRSGNRGLCAQPCRLPFKVANGTGHDLSLKDLSLIDRINELADTGICSFKIEGRMKRPEYVSAAVTACKAQLACNYNSDMQADLQNLFSRSGFTQGYYKNELGQSMFGYREKENVQSATKELLDKYSRIYEKESPRYKIDFDFHGKIGEKAILTATFEEIEIKVYSENVCEQPINRPISAERIKEALQKCGGTQFEANSITIDENIDYTLPVSQINLMRRKALALLSDKIGENLPRKTFSCPLHTEIPAKNANEIYCRFDSAENVPENLDADLIFVPLSTPDETISKNGYAVELPHGMFGNEKKVSELLSKSSAEFALCHTLDAAAIAKKYGKKVIASSSFNILNSLSADEAKNMGISQMVVSGECGLDLANKLSAPIKKGIFAYGRIPLMLTRNCPVKNGKTCAECNRNSSITDRKGISFPVRCFMGYSEILNSRPIYMADRLGEIKNNDFLFFNFTVETKDEVNKIMNSYYNEESPDCDFTRGLLYRGVE